MTAIILVSLYIASVLLSIKMNRFLIRVDSSWFGNNCVDGAEGLEKILILIITFTPFLNVTFLSAFTFSHPEAREHAWGKRIVRILHAIFILPFSKLYNLLYGNVKCEG